MSAERVVSRWYRSLLPDGSLWCETSDPDECVRMSEGRECTFQVLEVVQIDRPWREWVPDASH
jgi:hypothetical protein